MDDTFTVEVALGGKGRGLVSSVAVPGGLRQGDNTSNQHKNRYENHTVRLVSLTETLPSCSIHT